jgi:hypothetical protein
VPFGQLLERFLHLLVVPFDHMGWAWPILPVYTTLILGELYKSKVSFGHAVGNGCAMVWAGLNWASKLAHVNKLSYLFDSRALGWIVAVSAIGLGVFAIILGIRRKDKALCEVLGHTRFSCFFIIAFYPMQTGMVAWSWKNLMAILIFAIPCWFLIYLTGRLASKWVK